MKWRGSGHNTALAESAEVDSEQIDTMVMNMTALSLAPMYRLLVDSYKDKIANEDGEDPDWYLTEFASCIFYAGVIAGRRERGQRDEFGELLMDAPMNSRAKGPWNPK